MRTALNLSLEKKIISNQYYKLINKHMKNPKLFSDIKKCFKKKHINKILSFTTKDKKNETDEINLILLKKIGSPVLKKNFNKKYLKNFFQKQLMN